MVLRVIAALASLLAACGPGAVTLEDYNTRLVTLPDGFEVRCEVMTHPTDMMRGMMFRDSLAEDRGMLFVHGQSGKFEYHMSNVKIPLDIIWIDRNLRVVEISADTPPCAAKECPTYGGNADAIYVVELAGGSAAKHNVRVGTRLSF